MDIYIYKQKGLVYLKMKKKKKKKEEEEEEINK
jgi:hypothetical protein